MKEMLTSIYNSINEIVKPYKTIYPYQDIEADVDNGVITFAPTKIENLTLAGEKLLTDNRLIVDAVSKVAFEIDIYKTIDWVDNTISAFECAEKLQTFLKSTEASNTFYKNYHYELMPIWSDINFQADFNTYKKWVMIARFEIVITKMSNVILSDKAIKNIKIEINEINTIK